MNDTKASRTQEVPRWLLMIPQLPPKPDYLRVKLRRHIQRVGAVSLRNAAYVLPNREQTLEDFVWLRAQLKADDADAIICVADTVAGVTDGEIVRVFNDARDDDYNALAEEASALSQSGASDDLKRQATRLKKRMREIERVDFFDSPAKDGAAQAVDSLSRRDAKPTANQLQSRKFTKRTWVTRTGVFVDRIASAWLIHRFIDRSAKFKFVPAKGYVPKDGELRFDMYHGEFTHEGDRCTFETLVTRFALDEDPALEVIAQIVHDIDMKDDRFGRPESSGIELVLASVAAVNGQDKKRLKAGSVLFDGLYAQLGGGVSLRK